MSSVPYFSFHAAFLIRISHSGSVRHGSLYRHVAHCSCSFLFVVPEFGSAASESPEAESAKLKITRAIPGAGRPDRSASSAVVRWRSSIRR